MQKIQIILFRGYKLTLRNLADHLMYKCRCLYQSAQCVRRMLCLISCFEITTDPLNYCFKRSCRKYISKLLKVKPIRICCTKIYVKNSSSGITSLITMTLVVKHFKCFKADSFCCIKNLKIALIYIIIWATTFGVSDKASLKPVF